jgi:hypothetical protein
MLGGSNKAPHLCVLGRKSPQKLNRGDTPLRTIDNWCQKDDGSA